MNPLHNHNTREFTISPPSPPSIPQKILNTLCFVKPSSTFFKVELNGCQKKIPLINLKKMSPLFADIAYSYDYNKEGTITIEKTGLQKRVATDFLHYLATEKIVINNSNAFSLYQLAHDYKITNLTEKIESYILENLSENQNKDDQHFESVLNFFLFYQTQKFQANLFNFILNRPELQKALKNSESIDIQSFADVAIKSKEFDMTFSLGERGALKVRLHQKSLTKEGIEILKKVNALCPIASLEFANGLGKTNTLKKLSSFIPNLYSLSIHNSFITFLPVSWQASLLEIDCSDSPNLVSITLLKATKVYCRNNHSLTRLEANSANELDCSNCITLSWLEAYNCIKFNGSGCSKLPTLNLPSANKVNVSDCTNLKEIIAFNAIKYSGSGCNSLVQLALKAAEEIEIEKCNVLQDLYSPEAKTVVCKDIPLLKTVTAPKAKTLDITGSSALSSLQVAPNCKIKGLSHGFIVVWSPGENYAQIKAPF